MMSRNYAGALLRLPTGGLRCSRCGQEWPEDAVSDDGTAARTFWNLHSLSGVCDDRLKAQKRAERGLGW